MQGLSARRQQRGLSLPARKRLALVRRGWGVVWLSLSPPPSRHRALGPPPCSVAPTQVGLGPSLAFCPLQLGSGRPRRARARTRGRMRSPTGTTRVRRGPPPQVPEGARWGTAGSCVPHFWNPRRSGQRGWGLRPHSRLSLPEKRAEGQPGPPKLIFLAAARLPGVTGAGSGCLHSNCWSSGPLSLCGGGVWLGSYRVPPPRSLRARPWGSPQPLRFSASPLACSLFPQAPLMSPQGPSAQVLSCPPVPFPAHPFFSPQAPFSPLSPSFLSSPTCPPHLPQLPISLWSPPDSSKAPLPLKIISMGVTWDSSPPNCILSDAPIFPSPIHFTGSPPHPLLPVTPQPHDHKPPALLGRSHRSPFSQPSFIFPSLPCPCRLPLDSWAQSFSLGRHTWALVTLQVAVGTGS